MRKFLRFNIQIYKDLAPQSQRSQGVQNKSAQMRHMVCLQLVKGSPLVFLDFAHNF